MAASAAAVRVGGLLLFSRAKDGKVIHLVREINNYMRAHLPGGKITGPRDHPECYKEMEMAGWH